MKNWKNWVIFKPLKDFYNSLFNNNDGFSYRKILAGFSIFAAYKLSLDIESDEIKQHVIASWQILGATCIGLITVPQLITLFSNKKDEAKTEVKTEVTTEVKTEIKP